MVRHGHISPSGTTVLSPLSAEEACSECSAILLRHIIGAVVGRWLSIAGLRARAVASQVCTSRSPRLCQERFFKERRLGNPATNLTMPRFDRPRGFKFRALA